MSHLLSISMRYAVSSRFEHFYIFPIFYFAIRIFGSIRNTHKTHTAIWRRTALRVLIVKKKKKTSKITDRQI